MTLVKSFTLRFRAIGVFLFHTTQLVSALIGIFATSVGAAIIAQLLNYKYLVIPCLSFSAGMLVTLVIVSLAYAETFPNRWLLRGYRLVHAEYLYRIYDDDPKHQSYTTKVQIEALQSGIDKFENRYSWSGRGKEDEPKVLSEGHTLMGPVIQRSLVKCCYVNLGRKLAVGERTEVKIFQNLYDDENKFEPFLAKVINEPISILTLRVILPRDRRPSISLLEASGPMPVGETVREEIGVWDPDTGEVRWNIQSPVLGHYYEIRWEHKAEEESK